jgi:hypothetical protein
MLPRGWDGILVVGLGISAHRDAVPLIRMQPDIQNGGYAAGIAAADAARRDIGVRDIDVRELQRELVRIGNLKPEVLEHDDATAPDEAGLGRAVSTLTDGFRGAEVVLSHPETAIPLLKEAVREATADADRLAYARTLAVLGDAGGVDLLIEAVTAHEGWDEGWSFRAGGQFGANMSELDALIIALGRTGEARALGPVLAKARLLQPESAFSHFRAVALALEAIGDARAAEVLADLLELPGVAGHALHSPEDVLARENLRGGFAALHTRSRALREIMLARALYRCGDRNEVGRRILEAYANDLRGHWARHARAVLAEQ